MLANMVSAIEQGIVTPTTKSRLEELEKQQADLKEKVIIEESKSSKTLTKEEIQNFFKYILKECSDFDYNMFISYVKAYKDKIEIGLNFAISQSNNNSITRKIGTRTFKTETKHKRNSVYTKTYIYDIYVVI